MKTNPAQPTDPQMDHACPICASRAKPVDIPQHLLEEFEAGNVALFAGAGISTENRSVLRFALGEEVGAKIGKDAKTVAFPDLMEEFTRRPNGRFELISLIKKRFDYIFSHPEIHNEAIKFHEELATIFELNTIVTTNWDTNFEDICHATPFVHPEDVAFWEVATRRVLKIHGTILNYGSIVATRTDYERAARDLRENMIGSLLKLLMATKTVLYCGYSLRDDDFLAVHSFVHSQMKELRKTAYIVTPDIDDAKMTRYKNLGLTPILGDGTHFLEEVKAHLIKKGLMRPDAIYEAAALLLEAVREAHIALYDEFDMFKYPQIILAACYQDGLMDGLRRAMRLKRTGLYSHPLKTVLTGHQYEDWKSQKARAKRYDDVAYIEGYQNALSYLEIAAAESDNM